ncbi:MAG: bifunctional phosphopantothenoylcysteine decarboxylase/phosphopantothenate--cysteine ligase CoaBC [Bacteroidales bacterium]
MLTGKKILLGITGGIAAYKIPFLIRLLIKEGVSVKVVMTKEACNFVTPLTLSALSQNPVSIEPFNHSDGSWHSHIELGSWADAFVIAPLTANTMAKMATGITDSLLLATYLAARCPVFYAPSMDVDMYHHQTTQMNINTLQSQGNILIAPHAGELASGLTGMGRLEEPQNIVEILRNHFTKQQTLSGKTVLISSGPTIEPIDPVRFISNHSSGKMGNALALEAASRGAKVILVSGPIAEYPQHPSIQIVKVSSASEMFQHCVESFENADIAIMAAAVADYSPKNVETEKIKKKDDNFSLQLVKTKDILSELGKLKRPDQYLVGFALETNDEFDNAILKLHTKNLDLIVLNSLKDEGSGFGHSTNKISIIGKDQTVTGFGLKSKKEAAADIFDAISKNIV